MTEGASMLGINSAYINPSRRDITNALANGRPVICSVSPGDFTTVGHYIVLRSIDDRGMVEVFDPQQPLQLRTTLGHPGDPQPNPSVLVILGVIPPPSRCVIQSAPFHKHTSAYGRTRLTMSLTRLPMAICRFRGPSG